MPKKRKKSVSIKKTTRKPKEVPNLIKAISIIDYAYGVLIILAGALLFLGGTILTSTGVLSKLLYLQWLK